MRSSPRLIALPRSGKARYDRGPSRGTRQPRPRSGRSQPMPLPVHPNPARGPGQGSRTGSDAGPLHDLSNFTEIFLGAFRRDLLSFFPGLAARNRARVDSDAGGQACPPIPREPHLRPGFPSRRGRRDLAGIRKDLALRGLAPAHGFPVAGPGPARSSSSSARSAGSWTCTTRCSSAAPA